MDGLLRAGSAALLAGLMLLPGTASSQSAEAGAANLSTIGVNLNITPRRLTFDRNTRSATVYIFNQGSAPATFDVSVVDRVMLPDGEIKALAEAAASPQWKPVADKLQSAQPFVMATPRRVSLAPGKGQTIRVRVTPPPASAAGEYRTHLTVTTLPPPDRGLTAEEAAKQRPDELSFRIQSYFGLSIPVIVRSGNVDVKAAIENVALSYADISPDGIAPARRTPVLSFDIARSGNNSLFGNVEIHGASGQKAPIGLARGIGVYPEIDRRSIRIPLQRTPRSGEQLNIVFTDDDAKPGNVVARSSFTVS